jgi:uncharacterized membrane protein
MTRLLQPITQTLASSGQDDGFLSRLAKFIPSETGTLFTIVNAYLADDLKSDGTSSAVFLGLTFWYWSVFVLVVCFLTNIVLLSRMYDQQYKTFPTRNLMKARHIFASSCGFLIWAYAIKSPVFSDYYKPFLAVLLIGIFLVIVRWVKAPQEA